METSVATVFNEADAERGRGLDLAVDDIAVVIVEGEPGIGITAFAASEAGGDPEAVRVGVA